LIYFSLGQIAKKRSYIATCPYSAVHYAFEPYA
jgi:hypothetical protein